MPLTSDFKNTVKGRAERDPAFRIALLEEALDAFIKADLAIGKLLLHDCISATVGFEQLGHALHKDPQDLVQMLSESGNPHADDLFAVLFYLQAQEGICFSVHSRSIQEQIGDAHTHATHCVTD